MDISTTDLATLSDQMSQHICLLEVLKLAKLGSLSGVLGFLNIHRGKKRQNHTQHPPNYLHAKITTIIMSSEVLAKCLDNTFQTSSFLQTSDIEDQQAALQVQDQAC